jgi:uncharacterized protein with HEPN domain
VRNRIAHEYESFDYEVAWGIIKNELPALRYQLEELMKI